MQYLDISAAAQQAGIIGKVHLSMDLLHAYGELSPQLGRNVVGVIVQALTAELAKTHDARKTGLREFRFRVGLFDRVRTIPVQVQLEAVRNVPAENNLLIRKATKI